MMPDLLLIFTRNPEAGKVKKRLAIEVGDLSALKIYQRLLSHTREVTKNLNADKEVYYSETIEEEDLWESSIYQKRLQRGQDLGERMEIAFTDGFKKNYSKIVIIGSDLYDLRQEDLEKAFLALDHSDFVVGPAADGGYYLLGMRAMNKVLFRHKKWGTSSVLSDTLKDLKDENTSLLEQKNDIDVLEDLMEYPELRELINNNNR